ncbi:hypothetical protein TraAM80_07840 [Trypanosoma rangeli]|uniref:Uncharacterized protein n=1 Tax=Trypanosoma rangeli TaxID=5698 RepID=A0A422N3N1_TRYRA|nr:uncharacterized protein TraAM80_07840 [Trypanosoma rangeli]RNF00066.1 hypothetical protein TraAM80_07840 [Trypanosoma rangeli]|eukprot:RNF00066.1 hypothetical protein TraAM80_07840 [Trypanosoma rangeli]
MANVSSPLTFAEKMQRLLQHRAERQPLPEGYMRCPLNPEHQLPIAAIVTHLERAHQHDALALAPHAMYGTETYRRRRGFLEMQLHRRDGADQRQQHANRYHHHERRRRSRRSSYDSSSSSATSSQNSSPRGRRHESRQRYRHEKKQESYVSHNGLPVVAYNGMGVPLPPPPSSSPVDAATTWCGSYQPAVAAAAVTSFEASTRTLLGRYTLGLTIDRQSLMEYLLQFGSLLRCDAQPHSATFTVVYDTLEAASKCFTLSYPSVIIDGVAVELRPTACEPNMTGASDQKMTASTLPHVAPTYLRTCHAPPPPPPPPSSIPPPLPSESLPQHPHHTPSVITVGGKPVGIAMLGRGGSCNNTNIAGGSNTKVNPPKCVFIAVLKKSGEGDEMGVSERHLWEEFVRFGRVSSILVAGPRVVVEYACHESVEKITQALNKGEDVFTYCSPLQLT